jgi:UDP-N-acetylglucosamine--N-acetylmuramyl-(pentapeptide) pyrophosphoryl-undecaprenol N-acetylglucosamine transferase
LDRIYFAVYGSGLGHITRVLEISRRVKQEKDFVPLFSCSDQALDYLRSHRESGENIVSGPALDVEWTADGSFSSSKFIPRFPFMFNTFLKQVQFEAENISKFDPKLVVSDSKLSPILAVQKLRKRPPILTMINQFNVTMPPRFKAGKPLSSGYERIAGDILGLLWSLSDEVLMTDLPPPYTIGEANVRGSDVSNVVKYVGFISPSLQFSDETLNKAKKTLDIKGAKPFVFFQISGPEVTKRRFADVVVRSSMNLSKRYNVVISLGLSSGSGEPRKLSSNTWFYEWCPIKDELFVLSDLIVARSGHRTIGECIDAGKPAVLVPIHNHPEQLGNAERFSELGLGIEIKSEDLRSESLVDSVDVCLNDQSFRKNSERLRSISKRYNGRERITEIIESYR